jgi:hypothetical protein
MTDERIARLEAQREGDQATLESLSEKFDVVAKDVQEIKLSLSGQKGFIKGMLFVLLPIWSAITIGAQTIWERVTQGHQ